MQAQRAKPPKKG